jgi:hypothetical protein
LPSVRKGRLAYAAGGIVLFGHIMAADKHKFLFVKRSRYLYQKQSIVHNNGTRTICQTVSGKLGTPDRNSSYFGGLNGKNRGLIT